MLRLFAETVAKAAFKLALLEDPTKEGSGLVWLHKDGKLTVTPLTTKPKTLRLRQITRVIWKANSNSLILTGEAIADKRQVDFAIIQREV